MGVTKKKEESRKKEGIGKPRNLQENKGAWQNSGTKTKEAKKRMKKNEGKKARRSRTDEKDNRFDILTHLNDQLT